MSQYVDLEQFHGFMPLGKWWSSSQMENILTYLLKNKFWDWVLYELIKKYTAFSQVKLTLSNTI